MWILGEAVSLTVTSDIASFVSVAVATLLGTSIWDKPTQLFANWVEALSETHYVRTMAKKSVEGQECLHDLFRKECEKFCRRVAKLHKLYLILAVIFAILGMAELLFSMSTGIGLWSAFLVTPIVIYLLGCPFLAYWVRRCQNRHARRFETYSSVYEEIKQHRNSQQDARKKELLEHLKS